ncbi:hypothetical protein BT69DRAFT_1319539 [Atractiella rhizophila]|nr:hypothetical protein BT69DRAFT_1319539 [Atractiella rhizophila]
MNSLSDTCTPAKQAYDTCFNRWFSSYLLVSSQPPSPSKDRQMEAKAAELEGECGAVWRVYESCIKVLMMSEQRALEEKGLSGMVEESRKTEPLRTLADVEVPEELGGKKRDRGTGIEEVIIDNYCICKLHTAFTFLLKCFREQGIPPVEHINIVVALNHEKGDDVGGQTTIPRW